MTRHALIIGISEYTSFARLEKAPGDAEAVAQILEKYGNFDTIQRFPEGWNAAEARYYVSPDKLKGNVLGEALKTFLFDRALGQEALIYFTGHGFKTVDILGKENGYLATSDCLLETNNTGQVTGQRYGVSLDSLNQLLVEARLSSLLVLLDCCHSGYLIEDRLMDEKLSVFKKTRNACLIASSQSFEVSFVGKEHSIFTGALLEALSAESAARDGTINSLNLIDKIESRLRRSGQQPIFMGYGNSIAVVSYPPLLPVAVETPVNPENPYVGLDAFDGESAQYFFGRDKAIQELQFRLHQGRFLCIIGASGAGKSSLVKAGLLPTLEKQYAIASLTPGTNPPNILIDRLTSLQRQNRPFILFIDQFEEVFTLCKDDELRKSFFHLIAEVVKNPEPQGQVIIAIRGDFLDRCAEYPEIAALANETQPTTYMVEPLSLEELYDAIARPAKLHGVSFQGGLIERMAREVAEQPGALPLLQYALRELWRVGIEEIDANPTELTWDNYNQIGGVGGALDKKADLIYRSFPEAGERDLIRRLCLELVELGEGDTVTRRRVTKESLAAEADSPEQFDRVLDRLVQNRLVAMTLHKIGEENYEPCVEVTHEALLSNWGTLRDWISQNRDNLRRKRRFEGYFATWCNAGKSEEALLGGLWLSDAEGLREQGERLSAQEREFIEESLRRRDRELQEKLDNERRLREAAEANAEAERKLKLEAEARALAELEQKLEAEKAAKAEQGRRQEAEARVKVQKQRTRFAAAAGILATLTIGLGVYFYGAKHDREKVTAGALIGKAQTLLDTDNQLEALIASIQALKELKRLGIRDSTKLQQLASTINKVLERNRLEEHREIVTTVAFSPNGKTLVSGDDKGSLILWNLESEEIVPKVLPQKHNDTLWAARFSPDGKLIASAGRDRKINIWTWRGEFKKTLGEHEDTVTDLVFITNNSLATVGRDRKITIWNINDLTRFREWTIPNPNNLENIFKNKQIDFNLKNPNTLVSTSDRGNDLYFWEWRSSEYRKPKIVGQNKSKVISVRFSHDGTMLVSCDDEGIIKLWDTRGKQIGEIKDDSTNDPFWAEFSRDNKFVGVAKEDGNIKIWTVAQAISNLQDPSHRNDRHYAELKGHKNLTVSLSFGDSKTLASASYDKTVRIWDFSDGSTNVLSNEINDLLQKSCDKVRGYLKTNQKRLSLTYHSLCSEG